MKLATYQDGTHDGQLIVVSRDLSRAHYTSHIASRMQQVLDDWSFFAPQLAALSEDLNTGRAPHAFAFDPAQCLPPLPRPVQLLQAQCYEYPADFEHADLFASAPPRPKSTFGLVGLKRPQQAQTPPNTPPAPPPAFASPHIQPLNAASVRGPHLDVLLQDWAAALGVDETALQNMGLDVRAQLAAICTRVDAGADRARTGAAPKLFTLAAQVVLTALEKDAQNQHLAAHCLATPAIAFAPVALTADELGTAIDEAQRLHLPLRYAVNARKIGLCDAGVDQRWPWSAALAQAARLSALASGAVVLGGEIHQIQKTTQAASVQNPEQPPEENQTENIKENAKENIDKIPLWHFPQGHASLKARRLAEQWRRNPKKTPEIPRELLKMGDRVDIHMADRSGRDLFGGIYIQMD